MRSPESASSDFTRHHAELSGSPARLLNQRDSSQGWQAGGPSLHVSGQPAWHCDGRYLLLGVQSGRLGAVGESEVAAVVSA